MNEITAHNVSYEELSKMYSPEEIMKMVEQYKLYESTQHNVKSEK